MGTISFIIRYVGCPTPRADAHDIDGVDALSCEELRLEVPVSVETGTDKGLPLAYVFEGREGGLQVRLRGDGQHFVEIARLVGDGASLVLSGYEGMEAEAPESLHGAHCYRPRDAEIPDAGQRRLLDRAFRVDPDFLAGAEAACGRWIAVGDRVFAPGPPPRFSHGGFHDRAEGPETGDLDEGRYHFGIDQQDRLQTFRLSLKRLEWARQGKDTAKVGAPNPYDPSRMRILRVATPAVDWVELTAHGLLAEIAASDQGRHVGPPRIVPEAARAAARAWIDGVGDRAGGAVGILSGIVHRLAEAEAEGAFDDLGDLRPILRNWPLYLEAMGVRLVVIDRDGRAATSGSDAREGWSRLDPGSPATLAQAIERVMANAWRHRRALGDLPPGERLFEHVHRIARVFDVDLGWLDGLDDPETWNPALLAEGGEGRRPRLRIEAAVTSKGNLSIALVPDRPQGARQGDFDHEAYYVRLRPQRDRAAGEIVFLRDGEDFFSEPASAQDPVGLLRADVTALVLVAYERLIERIGRRFEVVRGVGIAPVVEVDGLGTRVVRLELVDPRESHETRAPGVEAGRRAHDSSRRVAMDMTVRERGLALAPTGRQVLRMRSGSGGIDTLRGLLRDAGLASSFSTARQDADWLVAALDEQCPGWRGEGAPANASGPAPARVAARRDAPFRPAARPVRSASLPSRPDSTRPG